MDAARARITRIGGSSLRDHSALSGKKHWDQNSCTSGTSMPWIEKGSALAARTVALPSKWNPVPSCDDDACMT